MRYLYQIGRFYAATDLIALTHTNHLADLEEIIDREFTTSSDVGTRGSDYSAKGILI